MSPSPFPFFVLMISIVSLLGPGLVSFFIAVSLVGWVSYARLARSRALVLRSVPNSCWRRARSAFRPAARAAAPRPAQRGGAVHRVRDVRCRAQHPARLGALSYLGLGVQPPTPEWGCDDRGRPELHSSRRGGSTCSPALPSCCSPSPSASSPTVSAERLDRKELSRCPCSASSSCPSAFRRPGRAHAPRRGCQLRTGGRRCHGPRRRKRLGQDDLVPRHDATVARLVHRRMTGRRRDVRGPGSPRACPKANVAAPCAAAVCPWCSRTRSAISIRS